MPSVCKRDVLHDSFVKPGDKEGSWALPRGISLPRRLRLSRSTSGPIHLAGRIARVGRGTLHINRGQFGGLAGTAERRHASAVEEASEAAASVALAAWTTCRRDTEVLS